MPRASFGTSKRCPSGTVSAAPAAERWGLKNQLNRKWPGPLGGRSRRLRATRDAAFPRSLHLSPPSRREGARDEGNGKRRRQNQERKRPAKRAARFGVRPHPVWGSRARPRPARLPEPGNIFPISSDPLRGTGEGFWLSASRLAEPGNIFRVGWGTASQNRGTFLGLRGPPEPCFRGLKTLRSAIQASFAIQVPYNHY